MTSTKSTERGFGVVEAVIVVAAIAVLSVAGWFVYQHNKTKVSDAATSNQPTKQATTHSTNSSPTTNTPTSTQTVVNIPELGISITVPNEIADLTYTVTSGTRSDGRQETTATFSTKALTQIDPECDDNFGPLGALSKITGQYPTTFTDSDPATNFGALVKQFQGFFIASSGPQAGCDANNSSALDTASKFKSDFTSALPTVQQLSTSPNGTN